MLLLASKDHFLLVCKLTWKALFLYFSWENVSSFTARASENLNRYLSVHKFPKKHLLCMKINSFWLFPLIPLFIIITTTFMYAYVHAHTHTYIDTHAHTFIHAHRFACMYLISLYIRSGVEKFRILRVSLKIRLEA